MASLRQQYYKSYIEFKQSDAFKSLSAEERAQINKTAKETYKQLSDNEAPMLEGQDLRDQRGVLSNAVTDLTAGVVNLGRAGVSGAAWAADVAGFPDAARSLDEKSQQMGETAQMISPPADPNRLVDFGSQALLQNIPTLAAGGALARALTGSAAGGAILNNARTAAGIPAMAGAVPLTEGAASFISTAGLYGVPAARQANVEADGEVRAGNPYFELAAAVPYALIENTLGITPLKTMRAFSGGAAPAGIAKTIAANAGKIGSLLEKPLFELSGKAGIKGTVGAFSRFVAENILGEATEEVFQAIEETAIPHFAKKPIDQAIRDTMADLGKPEVVDLLTQAKGGALVGGVLGGANSIARKITSISDQINDPKTTPEEAQKLAAAKKQLKDEMLQLTYNQNIPTIQPSGPIIKDPTAEGFQEPEGKLIHPQQIFGDPAPEILYPDAQQPQNIGTEGTMRDYAAYKQDKQATLEEQNATPMAVLRKMAAMKTLPDSDPQKQRFMKLLADRNWLPQEATEYPAGRVGQELQALDAAEMMPETLVSAEATPETPLLPYQPNQAEGRILADNGGVILSTKTEDLIMPKSGRPFTNQKIAKAYQTKNEMKDTHVITPVRGGFALMKKPVQQQAKRITVETPRGGTYDKMTVSKNIPTENRMRVSGTPGVAERIEKKLPPNVALPVESKAIEPAQAEKKQWFIDADNMPVYTVKSDAAGYRGPYSKQEIKDLTEVDPSALTEKTYGKEATIARRKAADQTTIKQPAPAAEPKAAEPQVKPAEAVKQPSSNYAVESFQGGFRVLNPQNKQYSWHTSKQAADDKAADLNSGKAAPMAEAKPEPKPEAETATPKPSIKITSDNAEALANAQKLRKSAASLLEQAQADFGKDRQTNTARRARMAAGATDDALNREAFAKTMNNLADAMERGEAKYLKGVKSRADLQLIKQELTMALGRHARKNDMSYDWYKTKPITDAAIKDGAQFSRPQPYGNWFDSAAKELEAIQGMKPAAAYIEKLGRGARDRNISLNDEAIERIIAIKKSLTQKGVKIPYQFARILETIDSYQKLRSFGIKSDFDLADALIEYRNLSANKKQESPLTKAERELIGKKFEGFDFFPTPPALAERMAQELDIKPGMTVLEPSAGKGDLADAVKAAQPEADVKVIEPLGDLREILTIKNHDVIDTDFENFETDQKFDRIIMNPPFSKNRDIKHVKKAFNLLAPGGKMVAIMGNHFTFANDKESVEFRDWLDDVGGTSESLGQVFVGKDAFRQTGVNSQLVTIEKPAVSGAADETKIAAAPKGPLYSAEYLVAKYTARAVKAGYNLLRSGITRFTDWAKAMLKQFGKAIGPKLKAMFADLSAILKSRTGAISGRPASTVTGKTTGQVLNSPAKMKDFQWKKENFRTVNLEYTSPDTGKVTRVAKLLKVNNKWFWADTNREFLTLATAAKTVKSEIFEKVRNTEREQVKIIEEARARRTAKQAKATKKVEAYLSQPTAAEEVTKKELPVTVADKISTYADRITRALFDRRLMLKKVQKLIELVSGKKLPDWANPYDRFDVIDGRIETNKGEFKDKYWQPIMADLDKANISYEDFNNFVYAMHAPERNKYINEINPGFREKGVAGSGWTNEKAAQVKAELFAKHGEDTLMEAGKKFWAMHSELLNKQVDYGLIDEEIKGIIDAKYKYYTPLKRIKDDSVILDARALGRRSEAQDQLMFSLAAIDTTFGRGEHNRVMQAFARMALLNPADQFYEIQKDKLKPYFDERTGEVQYRLDLWADRENTIHAKFGGRDVAIVVKDKDLLTAIKTKKSEAEPLFHVLRPINRILSAVNTAFNPDFILTNIFRDIQTAAVHASDAESWEMAKGILSAIPGSVKTSWQHHRGIDNESTRMYKEFLREGGKTGYSEIYQLQSLAEKLEKEMAERQANGAWYKTKQGIGRFMDAVAAGNDIAESATRFAGYQAARKSGMTAQKAAVFAKNLTINFNKKGTYGTLINTAYVFGNAALQGSHLTARLTWNMAKTNKGRIALASMIALGAMSDFLNRLISDFDDEEGRSYYDKISSDIKDNNFIVMLPGTGGNYISFPMAYGLNILPALGRNASSYLFGDQTLRETGNNILGVAIGAFNPMGNDNRGILANIMPTGLKPLYDVKTNTKWSGRKIRPDQPVFGADLPQSELYFDQTSKPLVKFTQWLNEAFGGNKYESSSLLTDLSPADLQYLIETFSGGVGKTIVRSADTIGRVASGKPVQVENVPVIRRFIGKARDFNVYDEFRANAQIAKRVQAAKGEGSTEWLNNNRESVRVNVLFKNVQKAILALRKNKSLSDETRKEKELILQKRFNKNVREIMQKNLSKN